jgi:hypothetical protein
MIPVGYMAKRVLRKPDWLPAPQVIDIYSVSNCHSENFADYIPYWKHNGYWFFDSPESSVEIVIPAFHGRTPSRRTDLILTNVISRFHLLTPFLSEEKAQSCDIACLRQSRVFHAFVGRKRSVITTTVFTPSISAGIGKRKSQPQSVRLALTTDTLAAPSQLTSRADREGL